MAVGVFGICGMLDGEFGEWLVRGCVYLYFNLGRAYGCRFEGWPQMRGSKVEGKNRVIHLHGAGPP